jgi:predicted 3-demethylubiquinone-9 3-methyltransferase (glyoxalase superfamily)
MTQLIVPCLWFDNQGEAAVELYCSVFSDARVTKSTHNSESSGGKVLTVDFAIAGTGLIALNGGPHFTPNPSISFFVTRATAADVDRAFAGLSDGGTALMPLGSYPWNERYGWIKDRYGFTWQIMIAPDGAAPSVAPCLMFCDAVHGKARAAMDLYASLLPDSSVVAAVEYLANEGPADTIKHGRMKIGDQALVAMDSSYNHGFTFNEALSLQLICRDQIEIDRYWDALCDGGSPSRCGWLKDRFGVSWQIIPENMAQWLANPDAAARDRAFKAMMGMKKLVIAELAAAAKG